LKKKSNKIIILGTLIYLFSFLLVFPVSIPLYLILAMGSGDPTLSTATTDMIYNCYLLFISIVGSIILNLIFKPIKWNKNNKITWSILIAHLFLIPLSVQFYSYLLELLN